MHADRWVSECGDVFREQKASWAHLIPSASGHSAVLAEHFFNTAATLMARQLRDTVRVSLGNFVSLLAPYAVSYMYMYIITATQMKYSVMYMYFCRKATIMRGSTRISCLSISQ